MLLKKTFVGGNQVPVVRCILQPTAKGVEVRLRCFWIYVKPEINIVIQVFRVTQPAQFVYVMPQCTAYRIVFASMIHGRDEFCKYKSIRSFLKVLPDGP